jgi:hypothetical protein
MVNNSHTEFNRRFPAEKAATEYFLNVAPCCAKDFEGTAGRRVDVRPVYYLHNPLFVMAAGYVYEVFLCFRRSCRVPVKRLLADRNGKRSCTRRRRKFTKT